MADDKVTAGEVSKCLGDRFAMRPDLRGQLEMRGYGMDQDPVIDRIHLTGAPGELPHQPLPHKKRAVLEDSFGEPPDLLRQMDHHLAR